jgi:hypothetical protein
VLVIHSLWDLEGALAGSKFFILVRDSIADCDSLSYMEMRLIIGKLLWHNDVHSAGGNERWNPEGEYKNMIVYNNWMKPPLYVRLTPRRER